MDREVAMLHEQSTDNSSALLTVVEAAAILRTPASTLRYWRHMGRGPSSFRIGRRVMYRAEDLGRWIEDQRRTDHQRRGVTG
ncbi:helix-turn-helix domain-containing protein [Trujillonella humicola]|uniref:helix-turn-helix domain-containing protein n=1 Tax=Trujillonella humicola TaxID=3383699 RepID=UPI003906D142